MGIPETPGGLRNGREESGINFAKPSRTDARELTRNEKMLVTYLTNTVSALSETKDGLYERVGMIDGGQEMLDRLVTDSLRLLDMVRETIPERQRRSLARTAADYEIRLTPKFTPMSHNVVVEKEDFRKMIDAAQVRCRECVDDCDECKKCDLYQLLTVVIPLDSYDGTMLCPYNMAEWAN